jgi:Leucine-rich repeat (LRR) protein
MSGIQTNLAQARRRRLQELDDHVLSEEAGSEGTKLPAITSTAAVSAQSSALVNQTPVQVTNARLDEASRTLRLQFGGLRLGAGVDKLLKPALSSKLVELRIENNGIRKLVLPWTDLKALQFLSCFGNYLSQLDSGVCGLAALQVLWVHDNELVCLPADIGRLTKMRELRAESNKFEKLPASLGLCADLEVLHIASNPLIPPFTFFVAEDIEFVRSALAFISSCSLSGSLSAQGNDLYFWCAHFLRDKLAKVAFSDASSWSSIPPGLGHWSRCSSLQVSRCGLVAMSSDIVGMSNLTALDLRLNRLSQLPTLADNIRLLNLSGNSFGQWPDSLSLLSHLEQLDISHNQLTLVPPNAIESSSNSMRSLSLANNLLTSLPFSIGQLSLLSQFDIDGNPLSLTDPDNPLRSHSGDLPGELVSNSMLVLKYLGAMNRVVRGSDELDLRGIGLRTVPESIFRLQPFKRLLLDKNLFVYVPMRVGLLQVNVFGAVLYCILFIVCECVAGLLCNDVCFLTRYCRHCKRSVSLTIPVCNHRLQALHRRERLLF